MCVFGCIFGEGGNRRPTGKVIHKLLVSGAVLEKGSTQCSSSASAYPFFFNQCL